MRRHLKRHMELQRYADFPDLQASELRRLLAEAETNARDLLAAQGYFDPTLSLTLNEPQGGEDLRRIVIEVDPGKRARVSSRRISFAEPMNSDSLGERQRRVITRDWLLDEGDLFTQPAWDAAKAEGLRVLQGERYPAARISDSQAVVNADAGTAQLDVTFDAGPLYRFGELEMQGVQRYDAQGVRNIIRLPTGEHYSEQTLLDAQQRLASSGYFDSAFLVLDTQSSDPQAAKVVAQLKEAEYQKIIFGVGYSTDSGPRASVDHTHNRMWPLHWRAQNKLNVGVRTQSLETNWMDMPVASGWAWYTGLTLERSEYGDLKTNALSLVGGRTRSVERTERRYYFQYDASNAIGGDAPAASSSLLANYSWTGRYFNNDLNPTRGRAYGLEAGIGTTVTPEREPFVRTVLRAMQLFPFAGRNAVGKRNRIALRAEAGAIWADQDVDIPVRLLFLTGGDTTVRGYAYQSIGNRLEDGSIYGARYMALGSIEWQHPLSLFGDARSFETAVFADAGAAEDKWRDARVYTGVGAGLRWASPVGPLQTDVAYGLRTEKWRIHLRVGFQF